MARMVLGSGDSDGRSVSIARAGGTRAVGSALFGIERIPKVPVCSGATGLDAVSTVCGILLLAVVFATGAECERGREAVSRLDSGWSLATF